MKKCPLEKRGLKSLAEEAAVAAAAAEQDDQHHDPQAAVIVVPKAHRFSPHFPLSYEGGAGLETWPPKYFLILNERR